MAANQAMVDLVYRRAYDRAIAARLSPQEADAFARSNLALVYSEDDTFDPSVQNRQGAPAYGLYQNHLGGRGAGYTPTQLRDPELNIKIALDELLPVWVNNKLSQAYAQNPVQAVAQLSLLGQKPGSEAVQAAMPRFQAGLQIAPSGSAPAAAAPAVPTAPTGMARDAQRGWTLPVAGPITSTFGEPFELDSGKTYQGRAYAHFNSGIDIGANAGATVQSLVPGTVVTAGDDLLGWGPRVVVRDPDGFLHSYGHLGGVSVRQGQQVAAGTVLGQVGGGQVGVSTGAHLSLDIFDPKTGEPVDPTPWLAQGNTGAQSAVNPAIQHDPSRTPRPSYLGTAAPSAPQQQASGGAPMPAPTAPTTNTRLDQEIKLAEEARNGSRTRRDEALAAYSALKGQAPPAGADPATIRAYQQSLFQADDAVAAAQKIYDSDQDNLRQLLAYDRQTTQKPDTPAATANAAANRLSAAAGMLNATVQATSAGFSGNATVAKLIQDALIANANTLVNYYGAQVNAGKLSLDAAASKITAQAAEQTAQVARWMAGLEGGKYITEAARWNAQHILAEGQKYVTGFAPDSPTNKVLARAGLGQMVWEAPQVDRSSLDPLANLQRAQQAQGFPSAPNFDIAGLDRAATTAQGIQAGIEKPVPITFGDTNDAAKNQIALPGVPDYAALVAQYGPLVQPGGQSFARGLGAANAGISSLVGLASQTAPASGPTTVAAPRPTTGLDMPGLVDDRTSTSAGAPTNTPPALPLAGDTEWQTLPGGFRVKRRLVA